MPVRPDHYALLGLAPDASADDIKRAYRRLAREWHPDVNDAPEAGEMFRLISEAHDVLIDHARRREYDAVAHTPEMPTDWRQPDDTAFEDLLDTLFTKGPRATRPGGRAPERGADILLPIEISLSDAARGHIHTETYAARLRCAPCQGTGAAPGATLIRCETCAGEGTLSEVTEGPFGRFVATRDCPVCHGDGEVLSENCPECIGTGRMRASRTASIEIPPGVLDGQKISVAGYGHDGDVGARAGDLLASVHVIHDPRFVRDGLDLVSTLEVPVLDAMLGTRAQVPTVTGDTGLEIPAGTAHGDELALAGRGMPSLADGQAPGNHRFRIHLVVPAALSGEARAALSDARDVMSPLESSRIRTRPQPGPTH